MINFLKPLCLAALVIGSTISPAQKEPSPEQPLRTIAEISALSDNVAGRQLQISVTGVVTAAEPSWEGQFFIQDDTGGVWVEYYGDQTPPVSSLIQITGESHPGAFAPIIAKPRWKVLGTAPLPAALPVAIEDLVLGVFDGKRVEVRGIVRAVEINTDHASLTLAIGGHRLEVWTPIEAIPDPDSLIASKVLARGATATHYIQDLRHLTGVGVYVSRPEDFEVISHEEHNPFASDPIPINRVAQHRPGMGSDNRIRILGTVTHKSMGSRVFIQDDTAALRITSSHTEGVEVGDTVEVVGFLEIEQHLPVLNDAEFRPVNVPPPDFSAVPVTFEELKRGLHHGERITLEGKVLDRTTRQILDANGNRIGNATTWLIQGKDLTFNVEYENSSVDPIETIAPIGSVIKAEGVCFSVIEEPIELKSVQLLLSDLQDIVVLAHPSWITPKKLLAGLAVLAVLLLIATTWSLTVSKKNATLKILVREKQEAQDQLREANENLEQKVVDRSNQLQTEMTARKASQLEFKATIAERTRLARDLHDTLEQALTGISLQLDTATKLFTEPNKAEHHVRLARRWLQQSQLELRQSIWDLRSRELEQFDLPQALRQNMERLAESIQLKSHFEITGLRQRLPETLEENILRIGHEAMTNIAKHANASNVWVQLSFEPNQLSLIVKDDGQGFDVNANIESAEHHYGLLGMRERAQRIHGSLTIESRPRHGTQIQVTIPFTPRKSQEASPQN
ncbi:histidine kinase [Pelagicoccus albus]|uniref:Sensor histidine kinase n=1 Tax=Pelagicoccus albus TaxID=415222 RepID=A0A7X1E960_9BACT|nr:sensor histidine kinase [Pelagicoccus albus]